MSQICSLAGRGGVKVSVVVADTELEMEVDTGTTVTTRPCMNKDLLMYN